jgi:hypothetical protein
MTRSRCEYYIDGMCKNINYCPYEKEEYFCLVKGVIDDD